MILLDSDHMSIVMETRDALRPRLLARLEAVETELALPVVVAEEQLRGWLAEISRTRDAHKQLVPYERFTKALDFCGYWPIAGWTAAAANQFNALRSQRVRVGTQDLKIASIALANDALLLSANLVDFQKVPGLRVADWLYSDSEANGDSH